MLSFTPIATFKTQTKTNSSLETLYLMLVLLLGMPRDTSTALVQFLQSDVCMLAKTFKLGLDHTKELKLSMVEAGNHTKNQTLSLLLSLNTFLDILPSPLLLPLF